MDKISVSNLIKFRRKSPNSQITFINGLNRTKPESNSEGGGDYWIHSMSAIGSVFKSEQKELLSEKIEILKDKQRASDARISKDMFQRNIKILSAFEGFNFSKLKPAYKLAYLPKPKDKSILMLRGLPVQVLPHHVFFFEEKGIKRIGAVWFVAKLDGYTIEELGIFTDALYRYLNHNHSKEYEIAPDFCMAFDVITLNSVKYTEILNKEVPSLLNVTLEAIKKILP